MFARAFVAVAEIDYDLRTWAAELDATRRLEDHKDEQAQAGT